MELPFLALPVIFLRILIMLSITASFIIAMRNDLTIIIHNIHQVIDQGILFAIAGLRLLPIALFLFVLSLSLDLSLTFFTV